MISTVMTAAAAVLMDEDLVCSVQVDQSSSADRLAAIDRTLQGWSFAVLTSEESSIFVTKYGEVSLMSGIRGTTSAATICGKNGHLYIPSNMDEIEEITELSKNKVYLGKQMIWKVNQPADDGIFASYEVTFGRFGIKEENASDSSGKTTVVGCISLGNHYPTLCKFEDIQNPVALCETPYLFGTPADLTIKRSDVEEVLQQSKDALAELRRLVSRSISKMGYSKKRISTSEYPDFEHKENCIFPIEIKIVSKLPNTSDYSLVRPSQYPAFFSNAKAFLNYLDQNQEKIQTYLSSEATRNPLRLVPDMDSGSEIYQSISDPDLLNVNTPLALIIGITLSVIFAILIIVHFVCSYRIGKQKNQIILYEQELLCRAPTAPEVY